MLVLLLLCLLLAILASSSTPPDLSQGFREVRSAENFDHYVVLEPRPTLLLIAQQPLAPPSLLDDFKLAAKQTKGHVRFAAVDVSEWADAKSFLKTRLGFSVEERPLPQLIIFGPSTPKGKGANLYQGEFDRDGFVQLAASSFTVPVPLVKSRQELDALLAKKPVAVVFSKKDKPSPLLRASAFGVSNLATLALCDASNTEDADLLMLAAHLNVTLPDDVPSLVVIPPKSPPVKFNVSDFTTVESFVIAVGQSLYPEQPKPQPKTQQQPNKKSSPPPTPAKKKEPLTPTRMYEPNATKIQDIVNAKPGAIIAFRVSGVDVMPDTWLNASSLLMEIGQSAHLIYCSDNPSLCQEPPLAQDNAWVYKVHPHGRSAPAWTTTDLALAVKQLSEPLTQGQLPIIPKDTRKEYFAIIARQWNNPDTGRLSLVLFGNSSTTNAALVALAQAMPDLVLISWFPDATSEDLEMLGLAKVPTLPLLAVFFPVLEDPVPPQGYTFKVGFFDMRLGLRFNALAQFVLQTLTQVDKKRMDTWIDSGVIKTVFPVEMAAAWMGMRQHELDAIPKAPAVVQLDSVDAVSKHCGASCIIAVITPDRLPVLERARELVNKNALGFVQFTWLDGTCNSELITKMGLDPTMLPATVVWFQKRKLASAQMKGAFSEDNLINFAKLSREGKIPPVSPLPAGLTPEACVPYEATPSQDSEKQGGATDEDDLMAQVRLEAEREKLEKERMAKEAAEEAKKLKAAREQEVKKRQEQMNKFADQEAAKRRKTEL